MTDFERLQKFVPALNSDYWQLTPDELMSLYSHENGFEIMEFIEGGNEEILFALAEREAIMSEKRKQQKLDVIIATLPVIEMLDYLEGLSDGEN